MAKRQVMQQVMMQTMRTNEFLELNKKLQLHGKKELVEELKRVNGYDLLMNINTKQIMPYQQKELLWLQSDMNRFVLHSLTKGVKISCGPMLLHFPPIRAWRDKKKYPIEKESND